MAVLTNRPVLRWVVPGAVVALVLGAAAITSVTADATGTLPQRSAAELLVDVQNASVAGLSGTVVQDAALGLPDLPVQVGGRGSSSFSSLVSGTHTLRVWYAGENQQRLAVLGTLGESDIVRNGSDVWTWSSDTNEATHYTLPARPAGKAAAPMDPTGPTAPTSPGGTALTPQQAADAALAAIDPTTSVTADGAAQVAGRDAYELVLAPKDTASLIGQVRIAIDAEQHIPLRVRVYAKSDTTTPAFQVGFTEVSFDTPGAAQFQFTPPPGATVTDSTLGGSAKDSAGAPAGRVPAAKAPTTRAAAAAEPTVVGKGWTSVLVATLPSGSTPARASGAPKQGAMGDTAAQLSSILGSLPQVSGSWGSGRLLQSTLFSALITDDGRVIAGAVAPEVLYRAAAK